MRAPVRGEQLKSAKGEVWIVLRCHFIGDESHFIAVDLIRQNDLKQTSRAINLTREEFAAFCGSEGIAYPP